MVTLSPLIPDKEPRLAYKQGRDSEPQHREGSTKLTLRAFLGTGYDHF